MKTPAFLIAAFFLFPAISWCEVNVLQNGSFERRLVNSYPDRWNHAYTSAGSSSTLNASIVKCGDKSLKIYDATSSGSEGLLSDPMAIIPGATYTAEAFIYRTATANAASLYLKYYDASMVEVASFSTGAPGSLNQWNYASKSGRAPANAAYAKVLCYSTSASTGTMYFDGVSFRHSTTQLVDNPDLSLDAIGPGYPMSWEMWAGSSEPVSVAADPFNSANNVLKLEDNSTTGSANAMTRVPVIQNLTYTASADLLYGSASPSLYLKYYDENGVQLASVSVASSAAVWTRKSVTLKAPEGAVEARILAYLGSSVTGIAYFDNFALAANYTTQYVASAAVGTGDGSSAGNAAKFNNATFWSGVDATLGTQSVKVVFLEGDYLINVDADRLILSDLGTDSNTLIMEGARPFASVFTRNSLAENKTNNMVNLRYAKNIVVRHLHWENDAPNTNVLTGYSFVINADMSGAKETRNIIVEGCSFVGLDHNYYASMGIHHKSTHNVEVSNCEFVRVGRDSHAHMLYNSWEAYDIQIYRNYFQDCTGSYVRHRAGCHDGLVTENVFVSTATAFNRHFIEQAVFNDTLPAGELLGNNFAYLNNTFIYPSASAPNNIAFDFHNSGYDPTDQYGVTWEYLLTSADAGVLTGGTTSQKHALMQAHYDLDFGGNTLISGNVRQGYHTYKIRLGTFAAYGATSKGGDGYYDISVLGGD
ncbi:MAG: hypothetical protein AB1705_10075 [Verrucomicrobiota bacterium]